MEIHLSWYAENLELILCQKFQFYLVEEIKNENKKRTRASLLQSSEDGKQEIILCGLTEKWLDKWLQDLRPKIVLRINERVLSID